MFDSYIPEITDFENVAVVSDLFSILLILAKLHKIVSFILTSNFFAIIEEIIIFG